ncbi:hypothetical protein TNCT_606481 [Trichonephila clavata]|uniref:Uncharacterized protein n=1 Tax=Trichonephila clavata TaxID=2740835 RepID=A0A8X6HVC1_TRICU|nr:hypothetical protein TNCT_606481 [Trichonephila clavata]
MRDRERALVAGTIAHPFSIHNTRVCAKGEMIWRRTVLEDNWLGEYPDSTSQRSVAFARLQKMRRSCYSENLIHSNEVSFLSIVSLLNKRIAFWCCFVMRKESESCILAL